MGGRASPVRRAAAGYRQANHFAVYAPEQLPYAIDRYLNEAKRLLRVLDTRLAHRELVAGAYSIADIATFPWVVAARASVLKDHIADFPNVVRWLDAVSARPAVARGLAVAVETPNPGMDEEARKHRFGQR